MGACRAVQDVIAAYAAVVLKTGEPIVRLVSKMEIDQARALNRGNSPAWRDHYAAMAIKTAIKRLSAWLPVTKVADAFAAEEATAPAEAVVEHEKPAPAATVAAINAMLEHEPQPHPAEVTTAEKEEPATAEPAEEKPAEKAEEQASTPKAAPEPEPQPAQAKGPGEKIKCPDTGKMVDDVTDCPNCPHRQGCPQWD